MFSSYGTKMQCSLCFDNASVRCEMKCGFIACDHCGKKTHSCGSPSAHNKCLFEKFYKENYGPKLFPDKEYDLNYSQLTAWELEMEKTAASPDLVKFARVFTQNIKYVSFTQFHSVIYQVANEIVARIRDDAPKKVYALIDGHARKSNTWVALLCWEVIRPVVTDVVNSPFLIPEADFQDTIAIIHMDDMSYSGMQMGDTIEYIAPNFQEGTTYYYPLIPYMGITAKKHLLSIWPHLRFSGHTLVIQSFAHFIEAAGYNKKQILKTLDQEPWKLLYGIEGDHILIYFCHKLADSVSIPNKMLAGLYVADSEGKVTKTFHAIHNCEDAVYQTTDGEVMGPQTVVGDFEDDKTCPLAFYKFIQYTFDGKPLTDSSSSIIELISKM